MKKFVTIIALAAPIAAPVFATPADAVMVGLLVGIAILGMATVMDIGMSSSSSVEQPALSQRTGSPAGVVRIANLVAPRGRSASPPANHGAG